MQRYSENKPSIKQWISVGAMGMGSSLVIFMAAVLCAAGRVRNLAAGDGTDIVFGPLNLMQVNKLADASGGYALQATLQGGAGVLCALCCAVQLAIALVIFQSRRDARILRH